MAEVFLYPAALTPGDPDVNDGTSARLLRTTFFSDVDTWVTKLTWHAPVTVQALARSISLWELNPADPLDNVGTRRDLVNFATYTGGAINEFVLPAPRRILAGKPWSAQVFTNNRYTFSNPPTFPFVSDDGTLHAYSAAAAGNGGWTNGGDVLQTLLADNHGGGGGSGFNFFVGVVTDVDAVREAILVISLPPIQTAFDAGALVQSSLTLALPPIGTAFNASAPASAAMGLILPPVGADLSAVAAASATLDLSLPPVGTAFNAATPAGAVLGITLPPVGVALNADTDINAALSIVLPPVGTAFTGSAFTPTDVTATLAITLPPVRTALSVPTPPPGNPDRMWAPILLALRDCLCAELANTLWGSPCDCIVVRRNTPIGDCQPGIIPVMPPPPQAARNGIAWVRKTDVTPVLNTVGGAKCVTQLVATFEIGVVRCIEMTDDGSLGDAATLNDEALKFESDDMAMRRVGRCCTLPGDPDVVLARWTPLFGGGCAGGVQLLTITARIT